MLKFDEKSNILQAAVLGRKPPADETAEEKAYRIQCEGDVKRAHANGQMITIPCEWD